MRITITALALFILLVSFVPLATAEDAMRPYRAFVSATDVYVRSGPGQAYYPTDRLAKGAVVEVYRHDPGGWCAIRPPEGSFEWVSARYVEKKDVGLGVVTGERVAARVGSRISPARDVIQIRLQENEVVALMDSERAASGETIWWKIEPPAGSFRWISSKYLRREKPADLVGVRAPTGSPTSQGYHTAESNPAYASQARPTDQGAWTSRPQPSPARAESETARPASSVVIYDDRDPFVIEIEGVEEELARMVKQEPKTWNLLPLRQRVDALRSRANTAVRSGYLKLLLRKVGQLEAIRRAKDMRAAIAKYRQGGTVMQRDVRRRYDGVGVLRRVRSENLNAPHYALADENGNVECYVTPAPGVNLRPFEGKKIGVLGDREYMLEQRKDRVIATHVTPLGPVMR